jgi:hypothetical protein
MTRQWQQRRNGQRTDATIRAEIDKEKDEPNWEREPALKFKEKKR